MRITNVKKMDKPKRLLAWAMITTMLVGFMPTVVKAADFTPGDAEVSSIKSIQSSANDNFNAAIPINVNEGTGYIAVGDTTGTDGDMPAPEQGQGGQDAIISKVVTKDGQYDPDKSWTKRIGTSRGDSFSAVTEATQDTKGYVAVGTCSLADNPTEGYFANLGKGNVKGISGMAVRFDEAGNKIWEKPLVIAGDESKYVYFTGVVETSNGDFIAVGYTNSSAVGDLSGTTDYGVDDAISVKIDGKNGNKVWVKRCGSAKNNRFMSIKKTASGYVIVGKSFINSSYKAFNLGDDRVLNLEPNGADDGIIALMDDDGTITNIKNLGGSKADNFSSVITTKDGGFLASGSLKSTGEDGNIAGYNVTKGTDNDGFLAKFDSNLNVSWIKSIGGANDDSFGGANDDNSSSLIDDGENYVAVGITSSLPNFLGTTQGFATRISYNGDIKNVNGIYGDGPTNLSSVVKGENGKYMAVGYSSSKKSINGISVNNMVGSAGTLDSGLLIEFSFTDTVGEPNPDIEKAKKGIFADDSSVQYNKPISNVPVLKWFSELGTSKDDSFTSVAEFSENSYAAAGTVDSSQASLYIDTSKYSPHAGKDGLVSKFTKDSEGKVLTEWNRFIGGSGDDSVKFLAKAAEGDGGIIAAGSATASTKGDFADLTDGITGTFDFVAKIKSDGSIDSSKRYITPVNNSITAIKLSKDSSGSADGYIITGKSNSKDAISGFKGIGGVGVTFIAKLDKDLKVVWGSYVNGDKYVSLGSVTQDKSGNYIAAGYSTAKTINDIDTGYMDSTKMASPYDAIVLKFDASGAIKALNRVGGSYDETYNSVQGTEDGGVIAVGQTASSDGEMDGRYGNKHNGDDNTDDALMVKYDKDLKVQWMKQIGGIGIYASGVGATGFDEFTSVLETEKGKYVAVGNTNSSDGDFAGLNSKKYRLSFISMVTEEKDSTGKPVINVDINSVGGNGVTNLYDLDKTTDGGYIAAGSTTAYGGINGIPTGRGLDDNRKADAIIMKFSKDTDLDGDGMPNNRDYYPNNPSKSIAELISSIDVNNTNTKLNISGENKEGVFKASTSHDSLKGLSAGINGNTGDSVEYTLGNVQMLVPVQFIDSIIGTDYNSTADFTKKASSEGTAKVIEDATDKSKDVLIDTFDLGVNKDGTAVPPYFYGKVKVTVNLSNDMVEKLKYTGTPKLYSYNDSTKKLEDMQASFDLNEKKAVFYTNNMRSYAIVQTSAKSNDINAAIKGADGYYAAAGNLDYISESQDVNFNFNNSALTVVMTYPSLKEKVTAGGFSVKYSDTINDSDAGKIKAITGNDNYINGGAFDINMSAASGSIEKITDTAFTLKLSDELVNTIKSAEASKEVKLYYYNKSVNKLEEVQDVFFDLDNKKVDFASDSMGIYVVALADISTSKLSSDTKGSDGAYTIERDINSIIENQDVEFNFNKSALTADMPYSILKNKIAEGRFSFKYSDALKDSDAAAVKKLTGDDNYINGGAFDVSLLKESESIKDLGGKTKITVKLSDAAAKAINDSKAAKEPKLYYYNKDANKLEEVSDVSFYSNNTVASFETDHLGSYVIALKYVKTSQLSSDTKGSDGLYAIERDMESIIENEDVKFNFNKETLAVTVPYSILKNKIGTGKFSVKYSDAVNDSDTAEVKKLIGQDNFVAGGIFDINLLKDSTAIHELGGKVKIIVKLSDAAAKAINDSKDSKKPKLYYYNKDTNKLEEISNAVFSSSNTVVSFETEHFSTYLVGLSPVSSGDSSQTGNNNDGNSNGGTTNNNGNNEGKTNTGSPSSNGGTTSNGSSSTKTTTAAAVTTTSSGTASASGTSSSGSSTSTGYSASTYSGDTAVSSSTSEGSAASTDSTAAAEDKDKKTEAATDKNKIQIADNTKEEDKKESKEAAENKKTAAQGMPKGAIVGIALIVLIIIGAAAAMILSEMKKKNRNKDRNKDINM